MTYRLLALGVFVLAIAFGVAVAQDEKDKKKEDKVPDLDEIMLDAHGEGGLRAKIRSAQSSKKLADAKKPSEDWVKLAAAMGKHKPPKGELASWKKLVDTYEKSVKAVAKA